MRKLVIYRSDEARRAMSSQYSCLVNFDAVHHCGEVDDTVGNAMHVDFVVVADNEDIAKLPQETYDSIELVGFPLPKYLL